MARARAAPLPNEPQVACWVRIRRWCPSAAPRADGRHRRIRTRAGASVCSFGKEFHGGGHGLAIRKEGKEEFLVYVRYQQESQPRQAHPPRRDRLVAKARPRNRASIRKAEYKPTQHRLPSRRRLLRRRRLRLPSYIHQYDKDAKWVRTWGGKGRRGICKCRWGLGEWRTPIGSGPPM